MKNATKFTNFHQTYLEESRFLYEKAKNFFFTKRQGLDLQDQTPFPPGSCTPGFCQYLREHSELLNTVMLVRKVDNPGEFLYGDVRAIFLGLKSSL